VLVDAVDDPNDLQDAETTEGDQGHALVALFAPDGKGLRYEKGRIADKGKTKDEGDEFSHGMYRGRGRFCLIHLLIFGPGKGGWQRAQRAKHLRWKYARVPMRMAVWIIFSVAFWSTSCGGPWQTQAASAPQTGEQQAAEPATKPAPPTPIAVKKAELGDDNQWDPEWDKIVEKALPPDLLSPRREHEIKSLCPGFKRMSETDRRAFWAYFFQALAGAEAGLKPTADVRHTDPEVAVIDPVTHRVARQEGLLQLAYVDSQRYGCDFDWDKDKQLPEHDPGKTILQPKNNLKCGIKILDNQLMVQHKPVLSTSSYWVTLRPGTTSFSVFTKQLANLPAACGTSPFRRQNPAAAAPASDAKSPPQDQGTAATATGGH